MVAAASDQAPHNSYSNRLAAMATAKLRAELDELRQHNTLLAADKEQLSSRVAGLQQARPRAWAVPL
jgi:hypothetical protein